MKIYKSEKPFKPRGRKAKFYEQYNPEESIDIKKTAESFGVSIQMVYRWIKSYNNEKI